MTYLIIDTSTELCLIALVTEGQLRGEQVFPHLNLLSKNLLPSIHELLEKNKILPSDLSFIAAGIGPGSYTGTRLGATIAKGLAFGLKLRVKPFNSPLAFLPPQSGSFAFLIPTRGGLYFILKGTQECDRTTQESAALIPEGVLSSEVKSADYVVFPSLQAPPECLSGKPCFEAAPNLSSLIKFLSSAESLPPEKIEIQYFHTPF